MTPRTLHFRTVVESPFAGSDDIVIGENVAFARLCVRNSLMRGEAPIASHLLYTQSNILDDKDPDERSMGIAAGLAWLDVADRHVFYTDRGWSRGMLGALHLHITGLGVTRLPVLRIRGLHKPAQLPASLDETIEDYLTRCIER